MARKRRRRNSQSVYLACAALLGANCLLYWVLTSKRLVWHVPDSAAAPAANRVDPAPVRPAAIRTPSRAVYPYSVIRGGAYSVAELDAALRADSVAAAHYAVFDRAQMHITYWTRRKVQLAAEEPLLTDGVHSARARCGNRVSLTPQDPTQAREPSAIELDRAEPPPTANPVASAATSPGVFFLPTLVPEIFPPLLRGWLPGEPAGSPHASAYAAHTRGFMPLPGPPDVPLLPLPEPTFPPLAPGVRPIDPTTLPLPPVGVGFLWIPPLPLPGGHSTAIASGPPGATAPTPPAVPGLPPGKAPLPGVSPFPFTTSGPALQPMTGITSPAQVPLQPYAPLPFPTEIPEPATAALLLCGAAILARRR
ncbi:MAG: hypothetical protein NTW28_19730, partial [Candidatus Solibacter sp.]|nr:hypothetical protein [Candidatus Solibacter sp.]